MAEEAQVGFLFKAASALPQPGSILTQTLLKSYYLMRCRDLAKDHGLPDKYFSSKVRCPHCFVEWQRGAETKVRTVKLSKRQKRRIKHYKVTNKNKDYVRSRKELLKSNEIEQVCSFCKHSEVTQMLKPPKPKLNKSQTKIANTNETVKETNKSNDKKVNKKAINQIPAKTVAVNVYSKTMDVYSLTNKNNTLSSAVKEQKVIKNNKKKKDKFAGLCQQAVLASAKLKQEKNKQNKLNLFLKPSS